MKALAARLGKARAGLRHRAWSVWRQQPNGKFLGPDDQLVDRHELAAQPGQKLIVERVQRERENP